MLMNSVLALFMLSLGALFLCLSLPILLVFYILERYWKRKSLRASARIIRFIVAASLMSCVLAWPVEFLDQPLDQMIYQDVDKAYSEIYDAYTKKVTGLKLVSLLADDFKENLRESNRVNGTNLLHLANRTESWRVSSGGQGIYYAPETITFYRGGFEYEFIKVNRKWLFTGNYIIHRD